MKNNNKNSRLSIRQIADLAGVSPTTVSFVLNGRAEKYNISPATCERVRAVVKQYNYRQNFHGRAIKEGKTFLVGVIIHNFTSSFWNQIIAGICRELTANGYHMLLDEAGSDHAREEQAFAYMSQIGVDGIISALNFSFTDSENLQLPPYWYEQKVVNILHPLPNLPSVYTDHFCGMSKVMNEFLRCGHRRIAFLGGLCGNINYRLNENYRAFNTICAANNIEAFHFDTAEALLQNRHKFTAVLCRRDSEAKILYDACRDMNISIPQELSIAGYGGVEWIVNSSRPRLTTVYEPKEDLGVVAVRRILALIDQQSDPDEPLYTQLEPQLVCGGSIRILQ